MMSVQRKCGARWQSRRRRVPEDPRPRFLFRAMFLVSPEHNN
jgi:hypothetical protein